MPRVLTPPPVRLRTVADLLERLGGIDPARICLDPPPGRATKQDLIRMNETKVGLFEFVERTLVEKPIGSPESYLAMELVRMLGNFVAENDLGFLGGPDALIAISPKIVREPAVCFISWNRRPERTIPLDPITKIIPNLVVEVLSPSNTAKEMQIKIGEYFEAGVELVWLIDPAMRSAQSHTSPTTKTKIPESGTLDGGTVLPGFSLPLAKLFEKLAKPTPPKPKKKK
jgi:Uma2 family endonuclease